LWVWLAASSRKESGMSLWVWLAASSASVVLSTSKKQCAALEHAKAAAAATHSQRRSAREQVSPRHTPIRTRHKGEYDAEQLLPRPRLAATREAYSDRDHAVQPHHRGKHAHLAARHEGVVCEVCAVTANGDEGWHGDGGRATVPPQPRRGIVHANDATGRRRNTAGRSYYHRRAAVLRRVRRRGAKKSVFLRSRGVDLWRPKPEGE